MNYWLMKSEPNVFSIQDLKKRGTAGWDGVRNYQARNFMRAMKRDDRVLFYRSNADPSAVVGAMEIVREAYPDPTQFDPENDHYDPDSPPDAPRWSQVDVRFLREFRRSLPLERVRTLPALKNMVLIRRSRLSVQPVTPAEWAFILKICS